MSVPEILKTLESLGDEKRRAFAKKRGASDNQYGVKMGDIRKVAKSLKKNHALALELWASGNVDARLVAILMMKPKQLSVDEVDALVRDDAYTWIANWLSSYIVKKHPERAALRARWLASEDVMAQRAGWSLTAWMVEKEPAGLDLDALLDRIESELGAAPEAARWTMNFALAAIGIHSAGHRERAIAIGESVGAYRDYPTSKGCTSPFAPTWIAEMVDRGIAAT